MRCSLVILISVIISVHSLDSGWTAKDYPNPRKGGYKECKMRSVSSICDPDEILSESERYRLNNDLQRLGTRTETGLGTFCDKKGIDAVLAVMRVGSQQLADDLNTHWNMDGQCKKSVIFLLSADDRKLYYTGESSSSISDSDFMGIIASNEEALAAGQYTAAIGNILKELGRKKEEANKKNQPKPPPRPDNNRPFNSAPQTFTVLAVLSALIAYFH